MTNTNVQSVEAVFRPRHQSFPFFTNAQEAYDYDHEEFLECLETGEHERSDEEMIHWSLNQLNVLVYSMKLQTLRHKQPPETVLAELPWDTSFMAGYTSAYFEFAYMGMYHELVYDGENDEQDVSRAS